MVANVNVKPKINKQIPRKVPLFRKANWTDFRSYMAEKKTEILNNLQQQSVEEIWTAFKTALHNGISLFVPIKKIGPKKSLPWITQEILEDLKVLRRSPDLFNNVKIGQGQLPLILIKHILFYHIWGLQPFRLSDLKQSYGYSIKQPSDF